MPRDIPIIFSAPMVRAIQREIAEPGSGKSQTRRLAWRQVIATPEKPRPSAQHGNDGYAYYPSPWQRVSPGDRLWVRENFRIEASGILYGAENIQLGRMQPSIHMPRWASRFTLLVRAVRVERLQAIDHEGIIREGWQKSDIVSPDPEVHRDAARDWFTDLWDGLHGPASWRENPEVVVVTFTAVARNIDAEERL